MCLTCVPQEWLRTAAQHHVWVHSHRDARAGGAVVPLAVSSGKMPLAAPKTAVKQKRRKGGPEMRLCKKFQETGNCTDPDCRLAHGADDLKRRREEAM